MYQTLLHANNLIYLGIVCSKAASQFNNMWQVICTGNSTYLSLL